MSRALNGLLSGSGALPNGAAAVVIGVAERTPVGVDEALLLARHILASVGQGRGPILVIVDSDSQRMSKRDELLGLNEFLSHLAKSLIYADLNGRPTIGLLYGHTAAGAFLDHRTCHARARGLAGCRPVVMDSAVDGQW